MLAELILGMEEQLETQWAESIKMSIRNPEHTPPLNHSFPIHNTKY